MSNNFNNDVIDISFSDVHKKRFRIDGDDNRILELDTSDMNVMVRIADIYPKLLELSSEVTKIDTGDFDKAVKAFKDADVKMRELVDSVFDADVCSVCVPTGSLYNVYNGKFMFEHIFEILVSLYESNIQSEYKKMAQRVKAKTAKYTGKT